MPSKKIPQTDCESEKKSIEATDNQRVTSCEPSPGQDGWCEITWEEVWDAIGRFMAVQPGALRGAGLGGFGSSESEMIFCWISEVPSKIRVSRASRQ